MQMIISEESARSFEKVVGANGRLLLALLLSRLKTPLISADRASKMFGVNIQTFHQSVNFWRGKLSDSDASRPSAQAISVRSGAIMTSLPFSWHRFPPFSVFPPLTAFVGTRLPRTCMPTATTSSHFGEPRLEESLRVQLAYLIRAKHHRARGLRGADYWNARIRRVQLRLREATNHRVDRDESDDAAIYVVRAEGTAITLAMREWLQHYRIPQNPLPPRPPQYYEQRLADLYTRLTEKQQKSKRQVDIVAAHPTPPPILAHKHYQKKRVALYARLTRKHNRRIQLAELDTLRKRAMAASARKWPPSRSQPQHPDNLALAAAWRGVEADRAAKEEARQAAEATQRRAEAEGRVAHLVERREAGRHRLGKFFP
ncbi:hypothetical protein R3P38DRAFT_2768733 [Favolaschia claudopus]|uniref:Uncharacterized protein n=1 Tax=Favolaschia claudopus TaxID=2862362 RepID=A0AAW0CKG0_9AGAR